MALPQRLADWRRFPFWGISIVALQGCAEPNFEFRGYSDLSSCPEVIDAELANGSRFEGGYASRDIENPGYVTELSGTIFEQRVRIDILCDLRGFIHSVHYISPASDPVETSAVFYRFAVELQDLFGAPTQISTEQGRSLRYLCHNPSPVLVDEWRLEKEDEADPDEHEVYLAVLPRTAECLEDTGD